MLVQSLCIPKHQCVKVSETATLREALQTLEETGYRCVPVLDQSGQQFKGNIYKMHIYRHGMNGGSLDDNVMTLIKNATKFIYTGSNFFEVFFSIKELPYIAVLNDDGQFFGILPHGKMLGMLEEAWNRDSGSYVLTVALSEQKGALEKIAKIVNKYSTVASLMTLDAKSSVMRRVLITLPTDCDDKTKKKIVKKLNEKGLRVVAVEDLAVRV
ncbi:cyclic di-AMP binding protein CbpA [Exiguobacterium sp. S22-S28]|uniref:cyclic di-AMP binding protein CbpA n=1 Tax=Exiguobacterium sp. S22-S28 TaxID=3342768 RepID=UPI00372D08A5